MSEQPDSNLLTPSEVGKLLRISVSTVYSAAGSGRLRAVTLWRGRRKSLLRFRRADIDALIAGTPAAPAAATPGASLQKRSKAGLGLSRH